MPKTHFIMGFSNWGKSTLIKALWGRETYYNADQYYLPGIPHPYSVQSVSNDDKGTKVFLDQVRYRLAQAAANHRHSSHLICAMCPTERPRNHVLTILSDPLWATFDEKIFYLLEHKFHHDNQLDIPHIRGLLTRVPGARIEVINADAGLPESQRGVARLNQLRQMIHARA